MFGIADRIGIDLGTASIIVFARGRGIVVREPSVVAISQHTKKVLAVGHEAREMLGRTPGNIVALRPLRDGVIADYSVTREMLRYLIRKACGSRGRFFKPLVVICIPSGATAVEERAALEAARAAGARKTIPIEEPMAAAIGVGLPIANPGGNMVVDVGGGTTDVAVISLGGIVVSASLRVGGTMLDEAIIRHIRHVYNLDIGERTSETIKHEIGSAFEMDEEQDMEVRGVDIISGLPKTVMVSSHEVREAMAENVGQIVEAVKSQLERTPPELAADIIERGITLTGGVALLRGLDRLLYLETGIPVHVPEDPISSVAMGTGKVLDQMEILERDIAHLSSFRARR
ncbi:MAG: rod shape-determining protein [candidate division WS1 bacterium]|jgi:rod shape-determining protein MreB|nr:rod shape-determining protein [candidate division WS1 bacterium]